MGGEPGTDLPAVDIVVTAYNNETTIVPCLDSIASQSYPNLTITIVSDISSRDGTEKVVRGYPQKGKPLRKMWCTAVGRSEARNVGWRASDAAIVMFADGDDVYEPDYIKLSIESMESNPAIGGVCVGGAPLITRGSLVEKYYESYGGTDDRFDAGSGKSPEWAWVYRKECLARVGGFDQSLSQAEDKDLCSRVKAAGYSISYVPGIHWHRRKPSSMSGFMGKEYNAGKRRVFYSARSSRYGAVVIGSLPVLFIVVVVMSLFLWGWIVSAVILAAGAALVLARGLKRPGSKGLGSATLGVWAVLAGGKLANSLGTFHGLLALFAVKTGISRIDTGRY